METARMSTTKLPSAPVPACAYLAPDGVTHWPAYSFEQMQQFARDAIEAHLSAQADWPSEGDVERAVDARIALMCERGKENCSDNDLMRAALTAVWHNRPAQKKAEPVASFQSGVEAWMGECFIPSLYSNMTERGDRLLEEVLELLQSKGYDRNRVATLVDYVYGRPAGEPEQEVGGVMVTLAGFCWIAGLNMHEAGDKELARITQPAVMAKIRAKQEAKNELHFDTPLPGHAPPAERVRVPDGMTMVPEKFVETVRAAGRNGTHSLAVPILIEEALEMLSAAPEGDRHGN